MYITNIAIGTLLFPSAKKDTAYRLDIVIYKKKNVLYIYI